MKQLASLSLALLVTACGQPDATSTCSYEPILVIHNAFSDGTRCLRDGPLSECSHDFGTLSTSGALITTIAAGNASCVVLAIDDVFLTDDSDPEFTLENESDERSATLEPLDSFHIKVGFGASAKREFSGALVIETDAANADGSVIIALSGEGE